MSRIPAFIDNLVQRAKPLYWRLVKPPARREPFPGTVAYWEKRYAAGGNSGVGSYGKFAEFKAEVINSFVGKNDIKSIIEFGCGDGNQLGLADYPEYIGFDVSPSAINSCREKFAGDRTKRFKLASEYAGERCDLALSLDVIYHLVEDAVFDEYMNRLFSSARRFVIVYSSNTDDNRGYAGTYIRHRTFTDWVEKNAPEWTLLEHIPNRFEYRGDYRVGSFADFFVFTRAWR